MTAYMSEEHTLGPVHFVAAVDH